MAEKTMEMCTACAAAESAKLLAAGRTLVRVEGGVNNKISCAICGRRRYGGRYELREVGRK